MEGRTVSAWRPTVNERDFINSAIEHDLRVDGRRALDFRRISIKFGSEDGSAEVQLGETHVMAYVTARLQPPYRDRSNEGTMAIFTEFSPMADPSFEAGRPGESAIELGRVIDRGLRESKAVDMESLCVIAGKYVWGIRVDLHILDNGGNLIDAANIAALAALSTFRRPDCEIGEDGQEVIVHDPEVRDPLPLTIHHLPIAVTFAFFHEGNIMVLDPTYKEEALMGGRMTVTMNSSGDICSIQKAGGVGVMPSVLMQCLRIASVKVIDVTSKIRNAVESYNTERTLRKVKRLPTSVAQKISIPEVAMKDIANEEQTSEKSKSSADESRVKQSSNNRHSASSAGDRSKKGKTSTLVGSPSNWDPYSKGVSLTLLGSSLSSVSLSAEMLEDETKEMLNRVMPEASKVSDSKVEEPNNSQRSASPKSLRDAVKPKHKRRPRGA